jgi:uncharacterized protein with GYD domain
MPTYVVLMNWTDQGARADRDTVRRREQADGLAEKHGARIERAYWTMGQYDLVGILEAPDDETATAFSFDLTSGATSGRVRFAPTITTRCRRSSKESAERSRAHITGPGRSVALALLSSCLIHRTAERVCSRKPA